VTQKTPAEIQADISANLPDNHAHLITPVKVRNVLYDITDSFVSKEFSPFVTVLDFGAEADGVTDDTGAFQDGIDTLSFTGGGRLIVPAGTYWISGEIELPSNVELVGYGRPRLINTDAASGTMLTATGTLGSEKPLSATATRHDSVLSTTTAHGAAVGDYYFLKSQRNCLHEDSGDWQLGLPTASLDGAYFAEFLTVKALTDTDTFTFDPPLHFPDYRADDENETDDFARAAATVQKVTFVEAPRVEGIDFVLGGGRSAIVFTLVVNGVIEGCRFFFDLAVGSSVQFITTLRCQARNCDTLHTPGGEDLAHFAQNAYKTVGAQVTVFDGCTDENGSQSFDVTYEDLGTPSLWTTVNNCISRAAWSNGMTSHSGSYGVTVTNSQFIGCARGPVLRSRSCIFTGNVVTGQAGDSVSDYGVALTEGWPIDTTVSNNEISGFYVGIILLGHSVNGPGFVEKRCLISDNRIFHVTIGIQADLSLSFQQTANMSGLIIKDNYISRVESRGVIINDYVNGAVIDGNVIQGPFGAGTTYGVFVEDECSYTVVRNNVFQNLGADAIGVRTGTISDTVTFTGVPTTGTPQTQPNFFVGDISAQYVGNQIMESSMIGARAKVGDGTKGWTYLSGTRLSVEDDSVAPIVQIVGPSSGIPAIFFGDADSRDQGGLQYSHDSDTLTFRANDATHVSLDEVSLRPTTDNVLALGGASNRWTTVYASTGTINTSDSREKRDVGGIPDSWLRAWARVEWTRFKHQDGSRWHVGLVAQQVEHAFREEGLDAREIGLLCFDEWGAEKEVRDEAGNVMSPARAAGSLYGLRYEECQALESAYIRRLLTENISTTNVKAPQ
jgi:hypothetical protein